MCVLDRLWVGVPNLGRASSLHPQRQQRRLARIAVDATTARTQAKISFLPCDRYVRLVCTISTKTHGLPSCVSRIHLAVLDAESGGRFRWVWPHVQTMTNLCLRLTAGELGKIIRQVPLYAGGEDPKTKSAGLQSSYSITLLCPAPHFLHDAPLSRMTAFAVRGLVDLFGDDELVIRDGCYVPPCFVRCAARSTSVSGAWTEIHVNIECRGRLRRALMPSKTLLPLTTPCRVGLGNLR